MGSFRRFAICLLVMLSFGALGIAQEAEEHEHASPGSEEGLGRAHNLIHVKDAAVAKIAAGKLVLLAAGARTTSVRSARRPASAHLSSSPDQNERNDAQYY